VPLLLNTGKEQERGGIVWLLIPQIIEDRSEVLVSGRRGWKQVETVTRNPSAKLDRDKIIPKWKKSMLKRIRPISSTAPFSRRHCELQAKHFDAILRVVARCSTALSRLQFEMLHF
jgi:hypothetical protein